MSGYSGADTCRLTDRTKLIDAFREDGNESKMGGVDLNTYMIRACNVVKKHTELCKGNVIVKEHVKGGLDDDTEILKLAKSLAGGDGSWKSTKIINGVF